MNRLFRCWPTMVQDCRQIRRFAFFWDGFAPTGSARAATLVTARLSGLTTATVAGLPVLPVLAAVGLLVAAVV